MTDPGWYYREEIECKLDRLRARTCRYQEQSGKLLANPVAVGFGEVLVKPKAERSAVGVQPPRYMYAPPHVPSRWTQSMATYLEYRRPARRDAGQRLHPGFDNSAGSAQNPSQGLG